MTTNDPKFGYTPATLADCRPGTRVWYHPVRGRASPRFAGTILEQPFCLCDGTDVVHVRNMEPAYSTARGAEPGVFTTVHAASIDALEVYEDQTLNPGPWKVHEDERGWVRIFDAAGHAVLQADIRTHIDGESGEETTLCGVRVYRRATLQTIGEVPELVAMLDKAHRFIDQIATIHETVIDPDGTPRSVHHVWDHACGECVPGGGMVIDNFRCAVHEARAVLAKAGKR